VNDRAKSAAARYLLKNPSGGFTLLEVLVAMVVLVFVMTTLYQAYRSAFGIAGAAVEDNAVYAMARETFDRLTADASSITAFGGATLFRTESRREGARDFTDLEFFSRAHVNFGTKGEEGIALIRYTVRGDEQDGYSLMREDVLLTSLDDAERAKGSAHVLARSLEGITFRFFGADGEERDSWNSDFEGMNGEVPREIRVRLSLADPGPKKGTILFGTGIALPAAEGTKSQ